MDYIKFTIEAAKKKHRIPAGMARDQYATLRAEWDEAVRLLRDLDVINETSNGEGYGAWSVNSETQERLSSFLAKVKP